MKLRAVLLAAFGVLGLFGLASATASAAVLTVTLDGSMKGSVTSQPFGIKCSNIPGSEASDCSFDFPYRGANGVKLTAVGADGAALREWAGTGGGTCTGGTNPCMTDPPLFLPLDLTATFEPKPERPKVTTGAVSDIAFPSAKVAGTVHANSADFPLLNCYVEYGTSTDYGATDRCRPGMIGSGTTPVSVTGLLGMVESDTTYHYRFVAINAGGKSVGADRTFRSATAPADSCPNAAIRAQQGAIAQRLPSCWAYELVSPPSTLAQDIAPFAVGDSGEDVIMRSPGAFADVGLGLPLSNMYRSSRTESGWVTESLTGRSASPYEGFSVVDWQANWWRTGRPALMAGAMPPYDPDGTDNGTRYMAGTKDGEWNRISLNQGMGSDVDQIVATADDMTALLFQTGRRFPLTDGTTDTRAVGKKSLVISRRLPDGSLDLRQIAQQGGVSMFATTPVCEIQQGAPANGVKRGAVDRDGLKRVIWTTQGTGCTSGVRQRVYVTEPFSANPDAFEISTSQCTGTVTPCGTAQPVRFAGASSDSDRIYMTTTQKLLDTDTNTTMDVYEFDFNRVGADRLRLVTGGAAEDVLGIVMLSDTASHMYYVARGAVPGAESFDAAPIPGSPNLYVRVAQPGKPVVTRFITTLGAGDSDLWGANSRQALATPDGRYLVVTTSTDLAGEKQPGDGLPDVYRLDSVTGQIDRAWVTDPAHNGAMRTDGANGPGNGVAHGQLANFGQGTSTWRISDDGNAVTLLSAEPLVPGDINENSDAFVWTASDGAVSMLSDGRDTQGVTASNIRMSADGSTFMLMTRSQILAQHTATSVALYAVRRNGGFLAPQPPAEPCFGEACQGSVAPGPSLPAIGSVTFGGSGNGPSGVERTLVSVGVSRLKVVTGAVTKLKVRVPGAGRISLAGGSVRRVGKRAGKAGSYTVKIKLKPRARKLLRKRKRLTVRARVSFRAQNGQSASKAIRVIFRQPSAKQANSTKKGGR